MKTLRNIVLYLMAIVAVASNMKVMDLFFLKKINPQYEKIHGSFVEWKKATHIKIHYNKEDEVYRLCSIYQLDVFENYRVTKYVTVKIPENMQLEVLTELSQKDCVDSIEPW